MSLSGSPAEFIIIAQVMEVAAQIARVAVGILLLVMAFYLQFLADSADETDRHSIPIRFRWPPAALSILILDRARSSPIIPFNDVVVAVAIYISFAYLIWFGFFLVIEAYNGRHPYDRIEQFYRWVAGTLGLESDDGREREL